MRFPFITLVIEIEIILVPVGVIEKKEMCSVRNNLEEMFYLAEAKSKCGQRKEIRVCCPDSKISDILWC